jgi:hypothetical protein
MIIIICTDDNNGMMFNHRRQSQDRKLREDIGGMISGGRIWMDAYSAKQFADGKNIKIQVDDEFLEKAGAGEYCFVEGRNLEPYSARIEKIIRYRWNRIYPADEFLTLDLGRWKLKQTQDFKGSSHDKITRETYER